MQILRLGSWLVILTVVFIPLERLFALHPISQTTNTPVPEPGSLMLLSTGLIGVGSYVGARYSKNKATNL